jgi:SAM-dependent methyltransferase
MALALPSWRSDLAFQEDCYVDVTTAVQNRYSTAAAARESALCCPVEYDPKYLGIIPEEVLERDYGCGDPSRFVRAGETVLDLGSGGGKICFIASQVVGPSGRVIGIDRNRDMLALARRAAPRVAKTIGYGNVEFRCGEIQDLGLDLERVESWLAEHPVRTREDLFALNQEQERLRRAEAMVAVDSIDVVVSNCVLNLVGEEHRQRLFRELYRVVRIGGRIAISDIVADEDVPKALQADPELWSGCISGAFREDRFLAAFAQAGFHGIQLVKRDERPWKVVDGIEFRSVTVVAHKGKSGPCQEGNHAVIYPGPWKEVHDDDGHIYRRGDRVAVCAKTYRLLTNEPYRDQVIGLPPYQAIPDNDMKAFPCAGYRIREPGETKNGELTAQWSASQTCCGPNSCC